MRQTISNIVLFQIGWFACVLGGAYDFAILGSGIALAIIIFHLYRANKWQQEFLLILIAMFVGFGWDSYLVYQELVEYPYGQLSMNTAPYWIVMMWGLFTTTLNVSLSWLKNRLAISVVFGAIGGPLAYYAGGNLGALEFVDMQKSIISLAIGWGIITPLLLQLSGYLNGFRNDFVRSSS